LRAKKSVCSGCATGCNSFMDYDPRDNHVYRLRPRDNLAVNKYWMCDDGMMSYRAIHEGRIEQGIIRNGGVRATSPEQAIAAATGSLHSVAGAKIAIVLSAHQSSEDNLAAVKLAGALGTTKLYLAALGGWQGDKVLRSNDNSPNRRGVRLAAGREPLGLSALLTDVASGQVEAVIALGSQCAENVAALAPLRKVKTIALSSNVGPLNEVASIVVPIASHGEAAGSFVNDKGMAQQFEAAIPPPAGVLPGWGALLALGKALGKELGFAKLADLQLPAATGTTVKPEARV
jgi:NADH-quinone oxidoreductase subunit G